MRTRRQNDLQNKKRGIVLVTIIEPQLNLTALQLSMHALTVRQITELRLPLTNERLQMNSAAEFVRAQFFFNLSLLF